MRTDRIGSPADGFSFTLEREKLIACRDASAEEKLVWLEEVNEFIEAFVPAAKRKRWRTFSEPDRFEK